MRHGFQLRQVRSDLVAQHQARYGKRPVYVQTILARIEPYLFVIVEELEKRGMPTERALMPLIESEYDPRAHSPRRASSGTSWQARRVGQHASCARLPSSVLRHLFSDWELALAAYN